MRAYWLTGLAAILVASVLAGLYLTGQDYDEYIASRGHAHVAPHGGALFAFGNHTGHIELVLEDDTRLLRAYVLDGHAEYPVRLPDETLVLTLSRPEDDGETRMVRLSALATPLSGETVGDSSAFLSDDPLEAGWDQFEVAFGPFVFRGMTIDNLTGPFPEGNE